MSITAEQMLAIGGRAWTSSDGAIYRIYLNLDDEDYERLVGLVIDRYKHGTGNIKYAALRGERVSNAAATRMLGKVWWEAGELHLNVGDEIKADLYAALVAQIAKTES
jgi:hypothetical protein